MSRLPKACDGKQKKDFRPKKGKKRSAQGRKPDIVKEIGIDELGQPTINGNPILKFRIPKLM